MSPYLNIAELNAPYHREKLMHEAEQARLAKMARRPIFLLNRLTLRLVRRSQLTVAVTRIHEMELIRA